MMFVDDSPIRHVRKSTDNVRDHRYRNRFYANKIRTTLCGAPGTMYDYSKQDAARLIENAKVRPDWLADVCSDCVAKTKEQPR